MLFCFCGLWDEFVEVEVGGWGVVDEGEEFFVVLDK